MAAALANQDEPLNSPEVGGNGNYVRGASSARAEPSRRESMKPAKMMPTIATSVVAALMVSGLAAQQQPKAEKPRYALIDLGTFGGPDSGNNSPSVILTNEGAVTGVADTAV